MAIDINQNEAPANVTFQLKGGMFPLTTLQLHSMDLDLLREQLLEKIQQAPNFFHFAPIVLDLRATNQADLVLDFAKLKQLLAELRLIPVGVKNASPDQVQNAVKHGFAMLRDTPNPREKDKLATAPQTTVRSAKAKIVAEPVRSGQQVYAPDGDLIILNQVSPGAELIAEGNIHVYGPLRGRALAGINGNQEARIFCKSLEAELVSVAGSYKISEDIEQHAWKIPAQVYIKDDRLQITEL